MSATIDQQIEQVQVELDELREWISDYEAYQRLKENKDFQQVFTEGYFKKEAVRLVSLKANPEFVFADDKQMEFIDILILGVSGCQQYLEVLKQKAQLGYRSIEEQEDTLQELHAEEQGTIQ